MTIEACPGEPIHGARVPHRLMAMERADLVAQ
jgi:hypothetical protein